MPEEAVMQRLRYAKIRTFKNLKNVYKIVIPVPKPNHFYCPKSNMFIRVEVDSLSDRNKNELIEFKDNCSKDIRIEIHIFKKHHQKPEIIEIK